MYDASDGIPTLLRNDKYDTESPLYMLQIDNNGKSTLEVFGSYVNLKWVRL